MTQVSAAQTEAEDNGDVHASRVAYAGCRLTPREHARAEAAAKLEGARFFSSFVRQAVLERAHGVLAREVRAEGEER